MRKFLKKLLLGIAATLSLTACSGLLPYDLNYDFSNYANDGYRVIFDYNPLDVPINSTTTNLARVYDQSGNAMEIWDAYVSCPSSLVDVSFLTYYSSVEISIYTEYNLSVTVDVTITVANNKTVTGYFDIVTHEALNELVFSSNNFAIEVGDVRSVDCYVLNNDDKLKIAGLSFVGSSSLLYFDYVLNNEMDTAEIRLRGRAETRLTYLYVTVDLLNGRSVTGTLFISITTDYSINTWFDTDTYRVGTGFCLFTEVFNRATRTSQIITRVKITAENENIIPSNTVYYSDYIFQYYIEPTSAGPTHLYLEIEIENGKVFEDSVYLVVQEPLFQVYVNVNNNFYVNCISNVCVTVSNGNYLKDIDHISVHFINETVLDDTQYFYGDQICYFEIYPINAGVDHCVVDVYTTDGSNYQYENNIYVFANNGNYIYPRSSTEYISLNQGESTTLYFYLEGQYSNRLQLYSYVIDNIDNGYVYSNDIQFTNDMLIVYLTADCMIGSFYIRARLYGQDGCWYYCPPILCDIN